MARSDTHNVLYLTRFFPPAYNIGGKRAWRMARLGPALGWTPIVVTDVEPPPERADPTPLDLPPGVVVDRGLYPGWWPPRPLNDSDVTVTAPVQSNRQPPLHRKLRRLLRPPAMDEWSLVPRQVRYLAALAKKHNVSLIHASGGPPSVLIHAWMTAKLTGLPFVAELRDPWTLSQLARPASPLHHRAEQALEKRILSAARRVVVTAEATAVDYRRFLQHLPADHVVVIRNAFEPERAPLARWQHQPGRLSLVHFGACYAERRLGDVLRAIALLRDQGRDVRGVTVRNIGRPAAEDVALAAELGLQAQFLTEPALPFAVGLEQLAQADVLLLPGFGEATQFLPGKLYDYMLAGRPVLATVKPSELADIVTQTGIGVFAAPGDVGQHAHWLAVALTDPQALYQPNVQALQAFAAQPAAEATAAVWQAAVARV